jgi:hypothetical protein
VPVQQRQILPPVLITVIEVDRFAAVKKAGTEYQRPVVTIVNVSRYRA